MDDSSITAPAPATTSVPPGSRPIHLCDALVVADKPSGPAVGARPRPGARRLPGGPRAGGAARCAGGASAGHVHLGPDADGARRAGPSVVSRAFEQRRVDKRYVAVVQGLVRDDVGEIDLPLIVDWPNRPRQCIDHVVGKPSLTRWQVLLRDVERQRTRLALQPITGRSHQLRVHLSAIGHPIFGDDLYAPPQVLPPSRACCCMRTGWPSTIPSPGSVSFVCDVPF